jgi:hypothetical protein
MILLVFEQCLLEFVMRGNVAIGSNLLRLQTQEDGKMFETPILFRAIITARRALAIKILERTITGILLYGVRRRAAIDLLRIACQTVERTVPLKDRP